MPPTGREEPEGDWQSCPVLFPGPWWRDSGRAAAVDTIDLGKQSASMRLSLGATARRAAFVFWTLARKPREHEWVGRA